MTETFVTQCPHCQTSFRVNRAQLGAAHGAVRCGACLHVFNAARHLLGAQPAATQPAQPPMPPAKPAAPPVTASPPPAQPAQAAPAVVPPRPLPTPPAGKPASDTLWIHDDLDLDSLDLDEELAKLEREEQALLSKEFLALEKAPKPGESLLKPQEEAPNRHDESWAEALLNEEPPSRPASLTPPPASLPPKFSAPAVAPAPEEIPEVPASAKPRSEPLISRLSADEGDEERGDLQLQAERDDDPLGDFYGFDDVTAEAPTTDDDEPESEAPRQSSRQEPALRDDSLYDLADEPLQLDWQRPKKPWGRWIGWGLLNLLALLALGGQYVWYHFDELARQDRYRPWFEQLCPELGCTLPSKVDIAQIKSSNLVVRSHPQFAGALVVDAILYNRAPFAQPFPLLELRFADLNGQLLASRRFKPSEYLGGELAGQTEMPPQTPIHISLDILDPGAKAVNYSLSFHSPE
ncbi:DUF3426 domain-containing protein [Pseudomonas indica]|uniref:DUF3426 domain-containing protein n=1 Tax=Pseudomonas indica TaxID=137658 RepID=UPI0023FA3C9F|nr:DUF3426 domain-containing protein [Pseudomonas indica]MBU3058177.1 zinc-ribbon domain-containing protein [Pseudomonas indica]